MVTGSPPQTFEEPRIALTSRMREYAALQAYELTDPRAPLTSTSVLKDMFFAGVVSLVVSVLFGFIVGAVVAVCSANVAFRRRFDRGAIDGIRKSTAC